MTELPNLDIFYVLFASLHLIFEVSSLKLSPLTHLDVEMASHGCNFLTSQFWTRLIFAKWQTRSNSGAVIHSEFRRILNSAHKFQVLNNVPKGFLLWWLLPCAGGHPSEISQTTNTTNSCMLVCFLAD